MLYHESPAEHIEQVKEAETRADRCLEHLRLTALPADQAIWALLTSTISQIELNHARFGPDTAYFKAAMINLARYAPMIIRKLADQLTSP
jgi:hypothetical protein